ncbi:MAG TPA: helix-turn-helix domain-containing protein [Frankiaceae bacterium]|nr:helix-turn-helix domain-containing protein [Frankiaceae bacterium]
MEHAGVQPDRLLDNGSAPLPREALADQDLPGRPCPVAASMALIGEKWSMLALREVFLGNHRFNDIARNTGAPRDRLAARLRALEAAGILERREYSSAPARYSYHLTPAGKALSPVMRALVTWGNTWAVETPRMGLAHHDHELDPIEVCRTCGEQVDSRDTKVRVLVPGWDTAGPIEASETG